MSKPRIPLRRRILYGAVVLVVFLLLCELGVRVRELLVSGKWSPSDFWWSERKVGTMYLSHPFLIRALRPGFVYRDEQRELHINSLGYRGPEFAPRKADGTWRIFCLGGSSTFGAGASSDDRTWPGRLQQELERSIPGRRWEVINAGVNGYCSAQSLINFALRIQDLEPHAIVVYHGFNDIAAGAARPFASDYSSSLVHPGPVERRGAIRGFLEDHSLAYGKVESWLQRRWIGPPKRIGDVEEAAVAAFRRNLVALAELARGRGARVYLCSQGLMRLPEGEAARSSLEADLERGMLAFMTPRAWNEAVRRYREKVEEAAKETGAVYVDVDAELVHTREHFTDAVHLTESGREVVARVIGAAIRSSLR